MTTLGALIDQLTNETLLGTYRAIYNALASGINNSVTDISLRYNIQGLGDGSFMACDEELMYVVPGGVNDSGKTVSVIRGARGTTPASHSIGQMVEFNPRFPRSTILQAMLEEAQAWPNSLYAIGTTVAPVSADTTAINLGSVTGKNGITRVLRVLEQRPGTDSSRWIPLDGWRSERDVDSLGGMSVFLKQLRPVTGTLRIVYGYPFTLTAWTEATDMTADCGIPATCAEILKYGAAWRLVMGRETRRLFTEVEGMGRRPEEIPVQANSTFGRQLKVLRDARLSEEIDRLRDAHGLRMV